MAGTRQQIAELLAGGLVVVDPDFSTLIQIDGDVCVSVSAELLTRESSEREAAWARHREHVAATLRGLRRKVRATVMLVPSLVATIGGVGANFTVEWHAASEIGLGAGVAGGTGWLAYRAVRWWWTRARSHD